jgi:hypothetical protein
MEEDRFLSVLNDIADSLRMLAHRERSEPRDAKAIRLLMELGSNNISAIAKACGVHRTTLYRSEAFRDALERVRGAEQWAHRQPRAVRLDGSTVGVA